MPPPEPKKCVRRKNFLINLCRVLSNVKMCVIRNAMSVDVKLLQAAFATLTK